MSIRSGSVMVAVSVGENRANNIPIGIASETTGMTTMFSGIEYAGSELKWYAASGAVPKNAAEDMIAVAESFGKERQFL